MCTIYNGKNSILLIKILKYIDKTGEHAYDNNKYNVVYIKTVNAVFEKFRKHFTEKEGGKQKKETYKGTEMVK